MQAPAKELLLFSGTIAAILASAHLFAAPCAHAATDRKRQTINHKHLAFQPKLAQASGDERQPIGEFVQPSVETGHINPAGQIAAFRQDTNSAFVMIGKVLGGDHRNQDNFRVWHLGANIAVVIEPFHQRVDQHESRYNPAGVHRFLLSNDLAFTRTIVPEELMGVN
jgi:hypothetical protein